MRWPFVTALLALEYLALTILVDFAALGPAEEIAAAARVLSPALVGAGAAGLLLARHHRGLAPERAGVAPEAHRAWGALGANLVAFSATAVFGHRLMGTGAVRVGPAAFAAWATGGVATVLLAAAIAIRPRALLRAAAGHARVPLVAIVAGLLSWRAVAAAEGTWGWLRGQTLAGVAALLAAVRPDVLVVPAESVVGAGGFDVEIAPMCSGVEGLGLVLVFQMVWLSLARARIRFGRALLVLVPLGAAAALAANVLRIAALVLLGASGREELAMGAFHSKLGWLLFVAIALGSVAIGERLAWLRRAGASAAEDDVGFPPATTAYVAPLLAALATALATSLWARGGFDVWYGARVAAGALVLLLVRRSLPRPSLSFSWVPLALAAAVCAVWIPWASADGSTSPSALAELGPAAGSAWIASRLLGSCLVLPIVEELAFRGFLLPWLVAPALDALPARTWSWPAVLVSSLAFGAIHEHWLLGSVAGIAFAAARLWRGRLADAIVAHVACNTGLAAAVLLGGRWELWS